MSGADRRELVLAAATRAFSRGGYAGTSTDAVAKEAGVSQPYVVRIFGTKLDLFLEVLERSCDRIRAAFEAVLRRADPSTRTATTTGRGWGSPTPSCCATATCCMVMMHGFSGGDVDEIAAAAARGWAGSSPPSRSTGCTDEKAQDFVAHGMLLNVMLSMRATEHLDERPRPGGADHLRVRGRAALRARMTTPHP